MDPESGGDQLEAGRQALEDARWADARTAFEAELAARGSAEALDGLGQALWFLGDVDDGIAARERAFDAYARGGRCDEAARAGVWISHQYLISGRASAARGWLARAERALEGAGPCAGQGWVAIERARHAASVDECAAHARRAMAVAQDSDAGDLEVYALSILGRAEVSAGRREDGMRLLEEAMAAAASGRVRNVHTLGEAYCNLIIACTNAGEWERAAEWCELVDDFARAHDATPLLGACRTVHADVLVSTGRWPEAEQALESALAAHRRYVPAMGAPTVAALAELRIRQGRLPEAEQLLAGREEHLSSLRALAQLRIAEAQPQMAVELLERGLRAAGDDAMRATQLLAPLVDARLACGDAPGAAQAADELAALAAPSGIRVVAARGDLAAARVALACEDSAAAADAARCALAEFSRLGMPLDAGEARLELARSLRTVAPDVALDEARTAFATFRELGASRAMDAAAAVLRDLGAGTAARPRAYGELTAREQQVLSLLAMGLSNAQIAQTLVISEKTAGHHVSRILSKLGVRNRTEAAAYAARGA
ncbi:helix-turn-helix transcriptional regulator [Capillimicrobium parvum]|uniref:HTH-type transcriptional regulator MalT n=1 Tax=Capillimicrobium parvum TaxID=2884022 RepID=A0A9E6XYC3_9ACTN|nr:LuxR C-terminal-related transcriptional regulator [Capillimicrobium parvum]UGS36490.1 HTH-type transcriptional regulator MalT [Capillimicrobium parvum]